MESHCHLREGAGKGRMGTSSAIQISTLISDRNVRGDLPLAEEGETKARK